MLFTSAMWSLVFVARCVCVGFVLSLCFVLRKLFGCFGFLFEIRASMGYFWVCLFLTKVKWWLDLGFFGLLLYVA